MSELTRILQSVEHGDASAADQLLPLVYDELRKLAAARMTAFREAVLPPFPAVTQKLMRSFVVKFTGISRVTEIALQPP